MKNTFLFDAVGEIDEALIEETAKALECRPAAPRLRYKLIAAACLAALIVALSSILIFMMNKPTTPAVGDPVDTTQVTEKPPEIPPVEDMGTPPLFFGNPGNTSSRANGAVLDDIGFGLTVRVTETLPDTYYLYDDFSKAPFKLVLMETVKVLRGEDAVDRFYLLLPLKYDTDLSKYDLIVMHDMRQCAFEYASVCNITTGKAVRLRLPILVCNINAVPRTCMMAISDGILDESLWTSTEAWDNLTKSSREYFHESENASIRPGMTLEEIESSISENKAYYESHSFADLDDPSHRDALEYVINTDNGIFVQTTLKPPHYFSYYSTRFECPVVPFVRYINGFPTNETVTVGEVFNGLPDIHFTDEDTDALPDLGTGMEQVHELYLDGKISPRHIKDIARLKFKDYGVLGWYVKTENGEIYGVIRVTMTYTSKSGGSYFDDEYFIVYPDSEGCDHIERDDLVALLGKYTMFVYTNEYTDHGYMQIFI